MLVSQMQNHEPLSWEVEPRHPHEVVEPPSCGRVLEARAFVVWKGGLLRLEGRANPRLQGGIHQQADGPHQQERHEAFGLFARERGGQKWRGFQEATSPFRLGLACISGEQCLAGGRGSRRVHWERGGNNAGGRCGSDGLRCAWPARLRGETRSGQGVPWPGRPRLA